MPVTLSAQFYLDWPSLNYDVLLEIMSWLPLFDLASLGMASSSFYDIVQEYVTSFIRQLLSEMQLDAYKLFSLLHETDSVISGSFALRCLFPGPNLLQYTPHDIDIYVPQDQEETVLHFLEAHFGYKLRFSCLMNYYAPQIDRVVWLDGPNGGIVNVIISSSTSALLPIFSFHSTMVMNFISSTGIYSAYNHLTRSFQYIPNNPILFKNQTSREVMTRCLEKYHARGFQLRPPNVHTCGWTADCPLTVRKLTDVDSFFFPFKKRPWLRHVSKVCQIYNGGGGVVWCLGGRCNFLPENEEDGLALGGNNMLHEMPFFAVHCTQNVVAGNTLESD